MTRLGTVIPKDFLKPVKPSREQKLKAELCAVPGLLQAARREGEVLGARLKSIAGEAVAKFFL